MLSPAKLRTLEHEDLNRDKREHAINWAFVTIALTLTENAWDCQSGLQVGPLSGPENLANM
jgi:hypothetical protein